MNIVQITFSPTGGTQRVSDIIAEGLGKPVRRIDLTDAGLKTVQLEQEDLAVIAAVSAVAEHSIVHEYAAGRPNGQDQDELRSFAGKILVKLTSGNASALEVPGNRPYKKAGGGGLVPKAVRHRLSAGTISKPPIPKNAFPVCGAW